MFSRACMLAGAAVVAALLLSATVPADDNPDYKHKMLSSGQFAGKKLVGAHFRYSVITDADFSKADLSNAEINYASASDAKFPGALLRGAALKYSVLVGADFKGADCRDADFNYSGLNGAKFPGANCQGAIFRYAMLSDADFTGADLRGADFSEAVLGGRFDAKTVYDEKTKFPKGFDPVKRGLTLKSNAP